jgi:heme oxygenase
MAAASVHTPPMLVRLERDTRAHHAPAEADLYRALDEPTAAGYRRFLATVYRFEYAVEAQLVGVEDLPLDFVAAQLRTGELCHDLLAIGSDVRVHETFARECEPPRLASAADAFGWMYVLQRNTLHHGALFRALAPHLRSVLQRASRYLTAYANDVHQRWHALGVHLDRAATTPERAHRILAAAHDAFAAQHRWYNPEPARCP